MEELEWIRKGEVCVDCVIVEGIKWKVGVCCLICVGVNMEEFFVEFEIVKVNVLWVSSIIWFIFFFCVGVIIRFKIVLY